MSISSMPPQSQWSAEPNFANLVLVLFHFEFHALWLQTFYMKFFIGCWLHSLQQSFLQSYERLCEE